MNAIRPLFKPNHSRQGVGQSIQPPHCPEHFTSAGPASGLEATTANVRGIASIQCTRADYLRFVIVAFCLVGVLVWLLLSRQLRLNFSVRRTLLPFLFQRSQTRDNSNPHHLAGRRDHLKEILG